MSEGKCQMDGACPKGALPKRLILCAVALVGAAIGLKADPASRQRSYPLAFAEELAAAPPALERYLRVHADGALAGVPREMDLLGRAHRDMAGDPERASAWFLLAAEKGDPDGQFETAKRALQGPSPDWARAVGLLRASSAGGDMRARHALSRLLFKGQGVAKDEAEAARLLASAAESGDDDARIEWGARLSIGEGVPKDPDAALRQVRRAAENGKPAAWTLLALVLLDLPESPEDPNRTEGASGSRREEAIRWLKKASDAGDADAAVKLAKLAAKDGAESFALFAAAASKGNREAIEELGRRLASEDAAARAQAKAWFEAETGRSNAEAAARYGSWLMSGGEGEDGIARGVSLEELAADKGVGLGLLLYAAALEDGIGGLREDRARAVRLYAKAADQGYSMAAFRLAAAIREGWAPPGIDSALERRLLEASAEDGISKAAVRLALLYDRGEGGARSTSEARRWLDKAEALEPEQDEVVQARCRLALTAPRAEASPKDALEICVDASKDDPDSDAKDLREALRTVPPEALASFSSLESALRTLAPSDPKAARAYALAKAQGWSGVEKDEAGAFGLWRRAAGEGDVSSKMFLAAAKASGVKVDGSVLVAKDVKAALEEFQALVESGCEEAKGYAGVLLLLRAASAEDVERGRGLVEEALIREGRKDAERTAEWLSRTPGAASRVAAAFRPY